MSSFEEYLASRSKQFDQISEKFKEQSNPEYATEDDRLWYPDVDKAGNGSAIIRFLPAKLNSPIQIPWVRVFHHGFQGPTGSWFIENCPTTLSLKQYPGVEVSEEDCNCPVCEGNRDLWNSGSEKDKELARERKRKLSFYSNIYILKDSAKPENNGTVKIFRYGKKIFEMLNEKMYPSFEDVERVNPFDLVEGCTFRLRFKKDVESGYRTYSPSEFDKPSPLFEDMDKMKEVYENIYDLSEFVHPDQYKSFNTLSNRYKKVIGGSTAKVNRREEEVEDEFEALSKEIESVDSENFDDIFKTLED